MALIRLAWFGASRLIPLLDSPIVDSSNASSSWDWFTTVVLVVLAASSVVRMSCAAELNVSLKEVSARRSEVMVSLRGFSASRTSLASVVAWPMRSP